MLYIRAASDEQRSTVQVCDATGADIHSSARTNIIMAEKITMGPNNRLQVPNQPTIPFIEGDGIGPDIWKASVRVFDAAIQKHIMAKKDTLAESTGRRGSF